jgi:hypothetical protein
MHDVGMIELRPDEFRELIDDYFQLLYTSGSQALDYAPIVARLHHPQADADAHRLKLEIFAAVAARKYFRWHAPPWVPDLPIRRDEIDAMQNADNIVDWLVGVHADSLRWQKWDYQVHPMFFDHVCGIHEAAPDELREDPMLRQIFPAKKLFGLDKDFCWHPVEEITQWRENALDMIRQGQEDENVHLIRGATEDLAAADRIYPTLATPLSNVVSLAPRA